MKNLPISFPVFFASLCFFLLLSCNNKKTLTNTTTEQNIDSKTKTIENMQAAYKGEKTATAKYEAFSKKAEEEGYHNIALLYNAVSAYENIHEINQKDVI